jgi:hypothetical protein
MSPLDLSRYLEERLTLIGRALDASAGAMVVLAGNEEGMPIYVGGLGTWGDDEGRTVSVSGILRRRAVIPIAAFDEEGSVSHGLEGAVFVIDEPDWADRAGPLPIRADDDRP